jgi:hypothetical protein
MLPFGVERITSGFMPKSRFSDIKTKGSFYFSVYLSVCGQQTAVRNKRREKEKISDEDSSSAAGHEAIGSLTCTFVYGETPILRHQIRTKRLTACAQNVDSSIAVRCVYPNFQADRR